MEDTSITDDDFNLTIPHLRAAYLEAAYTKGKSPAHMMARLLKHILQKCEAYSEYNIWTTLLKPDQVQAYIDALSQCHPKDFPLYGIPFAIKDNIDLANVPTTAACPEFAYIPQRSAPVVEQLIAAGAIPIGKTNMDQFSMGAAGTRSPLPWAECKNAFDISHIAGGSSSGSAVAVSQGLVSFALGTDIAGGIQIPAALNNIIGSKCSRGLLSMQGVFSVCPELETLGLFSLTTDDANTLIQYTSGFDPKDSRSRRNPFSNSHHYYGVGMSQGFEFGIPKSFQLEFFGDQSSLENFEKTVEELTRLGGKAVECDISPLIKGSELWRDAPWLAQSLTSINMPKDQAQNYHPVVATILDDLKGRTAAELACNHSRLHDLKNESRELFSNVDFLVTPTLASSYSIKQLAINPLELHNRLSFYTAYTNLLDCAVLTVPAGFKDNGIPFGINLVAPAFKDRLLLSYANLWQQHLGLLLGNTMHELVSSEHNRPIANNNAIRLVVSGAHRENRSLNWQLTERYAVLQKKCRTAASYRLMRFEDDNSGTGLSYDAQKGLSIETEIWAIPQEEFGGFVAELPENLSIAKVQLADGCTLPGLVCEPGSLNRASDISHLGASLIL